MSISAEMVKVLRERTGAGMMDCKKALVEAAGNEEKAIAWLREKGLAKAQKKAGRATSEGLSITMALGKVAVLSELKCETDFVARNEKFEAFAQNLVKQILEKNPKDEQALAAQDFIGTPGRSVQDSLADLIAVLGENMMFGRFVRFELPGEGGFGTYVHSNRKLGVLVEFSAPTSATTKPEFQEMAKNVAMQIAAANPICLTPDQIPADLLAREKEIYMNQAKQEGKPANILEKITEGRVKKFHKDVCLLEQSYIRDDSITIQTLIKNASKALGAEIQAKRFVRLVLGEGEGK